MKNLLLIAGGLFWFGFLFLVTFFITFPSDAVVERARWEVSERSNGQYSLELDDLSPWWLGASAADVKLYSVPRSGDPSLALLAKDLRVSASPFSLLSRAPTLSGSITPIDGTLYYSVGTARSEKKGDLKVNGVEVSADGFPLMELLLLSGTDAAGTGGLDIDIDVDGDESLKGSSGHVRIEGSGLSLSELEIPGVGPLGMDIPIDELDIDIKVDKGNASFKKGEIKSSLLQADLKGNILLASTMERSTMNVEIVLSNLGSDLQGFAPMLAQAEVSPGSETYKFTCSGTVGNPRCEMGEGKAVGARNPRDRSNRASRGSRSEDRAARPPRERPDADELKKKREERLERLRKLREDRAAEVRERDNEEFDDEPEDEEEPFDEVDDEEFLEEDEEFLDDEEFFDDEG